MSVWDSEWKKFDSRSYDRQILKNLYNLEKHQLYRCLKDCSSNSIRPLRVLETGCGSGLLTLQLARNFPIELYFIDISLEALEIAKRNAKKMGVDSVKLRQGDIRKIPYEAGFFDVVYSGGVNEHLTGEDRYLSFREMVRVTRRGGVVCIHVPNSRCPPATIGKALLQFFRLWSFGVEIPYSRDEIVSIINRLEDVQSARIDVCGDSNLLLSLLWLPPLILFNFTKFEIPLRRCIGRINLPIVDKYCGEWLSVMLVKGNFKTKNTGAPQKKIKIKKSK